MYTRTKVICTLGPATCDQSSIERLIEAGMNVARINFSHGTLDEHKQTIERVKIAREKLGVPVAILLDTKGPEIRIGVLATPIEVKTKDKIHFVKDPKNPNEITLTPIEVLQSLKVGMKVLIDDGYLSMVVRRVEENFVEVEAENPGKIKSQKNVHVPEAYLPLPAMTQKDVEDIQFGCRQGIDLIAASFIRSAEHVLKIKSLLAEEKCPEIPVISKIESNEGVKNFDSILEVSDGIMIARGDLGVEMELSQVPILQKKMMKKCALALKPSIIATQMLESMIVSPRPTRAEVSDVANAIYDSASAVMLSGETAVGAYPIETVLQMKNIIYQTEMDFSYLDFFSKKDRVCTCSISYAMAFAALSAAYTVNAKAIFLYSSSGYTARLLSALRPNLPIVALTTNLRTYYRLSFLWGVTPVYSEACADSLEAFDILSRYAQEKNMVTFGDLVVVTAGVPFGRKGSTNMVRVESIGRILVRGVKGYGSLVEGKVKILLSPDSVDPEECFGKILVIPKAGNRFIPHMRKAAGVILQNIEGDTDSEKFAISIAETVNIPLLVQADNAMTLLSEGEGVVMDPEKGLVYKK